MNPDDICSKIVAQIPDAQIKLIDLTGTQDHWEAHIVSAAFEGKNHLERHRMVFACLTEELKGPIHALSLQLSTP